MGAFVFFRIVVSATYFVDKKGRRKKKPGFPFVGWPTINIVSENHV